MRKFRSKLSWKNIFFLLVIAKLIDSLCRCCRKKTRKINPAIKINTFEANFIKNQLIILKKEGISDDDFVKWQKENLGSRNIKRSGVCKKCDHDLQLWEGENVSVLIEDKAAQGGIPLDTGGGVQGSGGEDEVAFFCYNVLIDLPEPVDCSPRISKVDRDVAGNPDAGPVVTIAVFDTGIMPHIFDDYILSVQENCLPGGKNGWNFVKDNAVTDDDHSGKHGTLVSKFIIDQATKFQNHRINILPVKVHNKNGQGNLFNILCAFAYAANSGAQLINASFGFYVKNTSAPPGILTEFVKKHLKANNILVIAAAGNANALEDTQFLAGQQPGYPQQKARDLDEHHFFPACLSKDFKNILTVTTVYVDGTEASVSPAQNFSKNFVNIGVSCDQVQGDDYDFFNPLTGNHPMISGSSYATPVITGIIAQHYNKLITAMPNHVFVNTLVVEQLASANLVKKNHHLQHAIQEGYYYK